MANKLPKAAMPFDVSKYQTKGATSEMEVSINEDKFIITTRQLPWFEKSDITTKCISVTDSENVLYSHWTLVASLLKLGMSYQDILGLSESELTYLLASLGAMNDKEKQDSERRR